MTDVARGLLGLSMLALACWVFATGRVKKVAERGVRDREAWNLDRNETGQLVAAYMLFGILAIAGLGFFVEFVLALVS